jgi:hypothetical protein
MVKALAWIIVIAAVIAEIIGIVGILVKNRVLGIRADVHLESGNRYLGSSVDTVDRLRK